MPDTPTASRTPDDSPIALADLPKVVPTAPVPEVVREIGGRKDGPDPTRYGDWEKNGRCIDF